MEEKIERILLGELHCLNNEDEVKPYLRMKAAEIARLVEEEFAEAISKALDSYIIQLDARRELNDELRAENTELLAQLAETQKLAKALREQHDDRSTVGSWGPAVVLKGTKECGCHLCMMARAALSTAPVEVLWIFNAKIAHSEEGEIAQSWIIAEKKPIDERIGKDDEQVEVFIIRKRDDEKPKP